MWKQILIKNKSAQLLCTSMRSEFSKVTLFILHLFLCTDTQYPLHEENLLVVALFRLIFFVSKVSVLFKLQLFLISDVIVFIEDKGIRVILLRYRT